MRHWTQKERDRQSQKIRQWQPWKTVGVKTDACKKASSQNARKHGRYGAEAKAIYGYLAASRLLVKTLERKRKERLAARKSALRAARLGPQKVLHITCDAPSASRACPVFVRGSRGAPMEMPEITWTASPRHATG